KILLARTLARAGRGMTLDPDFSKTGRYAPHSEKHRPWRYRKRGSRGQLKKSVRNRKTRERRRDSLKIQITSDRSRFASELPQYGQFAADTNDPPPCFRGASGKYLMAC